MKVLVRVALILACALLLFRSYQEREALESCLSDVDNKCGNIISYAVSLEEENARLNKLLQSCKNAD